MAKNDFSSVDAYIAAQPEHVQQVLNHVRDAIRQAVPTAEEVISYKMPTYKLRGERLLYFAVWKHHYALYAATLQVIAAPGDELTVFEVDKGTIRFPLSAPVPVKLIRNIAKFRAKQIVDQQK